MFTWLPASALSLTTYSGLPASYPFAEAEALGVVGSGAGIAEHQRAAVPAHLAELRVAEILPGDLPHALLWRRGRSRCLCLALEHARLALSQ